MKYLCMIWCCAAYTVASSQLAITYRVDADLNGREVSGGVEYAITNTGEVQVDTLYIHLVANALVDRKSAYTQETVKLGRLWSYFDQKNRSAGYNFISVRQSGKPLQVSMRGRLDEFVYVVIDGGILPGETSVLEVNYELTLPHCHRVMGVCGDDVALQYWYPLVAAREDAKWTCKPFSYSYKSPYQLSTHEVTLRHDPALSAVGHGVGEVEQQAEVTQSLLVQTAATSSFFLVRDYKGVEEVLISASDTTYLHVVADRKSQSRLKAVRELVTFFTNLFGPPSDKEIIVVWTDGRAALQGMPSYYERSDTEPLPLAYDMARYWLADISPVVWLRNGLSMYYALKYVHGDDVPKDVRCGCGRDEIMRKELVEYYKTGYLLPLNSEVVDYGKADYRINLGYQPRQAISHLGSYLGDSLDAALRSMRSGENPIRSVSDFRTELERYTGEELFWFFNGVVSGSQVDYSVSGFREQIVIKHEGETVAPMPWKVQYWDGITAEGWLPPFSGDTTITLPEEPDNFVLDVYGRTMDLDYANNYLHRPRKYRLIDYQANDIEKTVSLHPILSYNNTDRLTPGLSLHNNPRVPSRFYYHVSPQYSTGAGYIVGSAAARAVSPVGRGGVDRVEYQFSWRDFSYDAFPSFGSDEAVYATFLRLSPSVRMYLDHLEHTTYTELEYIFVRDDAPLSVADPARTDNRNARYLRWGLHSVDHGYIHTTDYSVMAEAGRYDSGTFRVLENYLRLSAEVTKSWRYRLKHKVQWRLWGAAMLANTLSSEAANTRISKGVIALSHQPSNDYSFDQYYIDRLSTSSLMSRQVQTGMQGGFRHAVGWEAGADLGQSQRYAVAMNLDVDVPIKAIYPAVLQLTGDVGGYNQRTGFNASEFKILYSAGLSLKLPVVTVHLPIFYSDAFVNAYQAADRSFVDRITFSIDMDRLDFWTHSYERWK